MLALNTTTHKKTAGASPAVFCFSMFHVKHIEEAF